MPIYEFTCQTCGHNFDKMCKVNDNLDELLCPACGEKKVRKRISTFGCTGVSIGGDSSGCGTCSSHNCSSCSH